MKFKKICSVLLLLSLITVIFGAVVFAQSGPQVTDVIVNGDGTITLVFNEAVKASSNFNINSVDIVDSSGNPVEVKGVVSGGVNTKEVIVYAPNTKSGASYNVSISKGFVKDSSGNSNVATTSGNSVGIVDSIINSITDLWNSLVNAIMGIFGLNSTSTNTTTINTSQSNTSNVISTNTSDNSGTSQSGNSSSQNTTKQTCTSGPKCALINHKIQ